MNKDGWKQKLATVKNLLIVGGACGKQRYIKRRDNWTICGVNNSALNPDFTFICQEDYRTPQFNISGCKLGVFFEGNDEQWEGWKDLCNSLDVPCYRYCAELHLNDCPLSPEWNCLSQFHKDVNTKPLSGLVPVYLFTEVIPFKGWIELTGFDFYLNKETLEIPYRLGCHNIPPQVDWLIAQTRKNNILLRPEMSPLLENRHWWKEPKTISYQEFYNRLLRTGVFQLGHNKKDL